MNSIPNVAPIYELGRLAGNTPRVADAIAERPLAERPRIELDRTPSRHITQEVLRSVMTERGDDPAMSDADNTFDQQSLLDEGFDRAQRLANGRAEAEDLAWLSKGFSAFLGAGGALPLERCLGLPRNDSALRRACRDYWLRKAWKALRTEMSPWRRSEKLAIAVRDFQSRQWVRWRALDDVPPFASELEAALFQAFRSAERVPRTAMQLHNIANHRRHS
jgi:hypothetical protein